MKNWIKRHKFWTVWLIALGVMLTLVGVVDVWLFMQLLTLGAICYVAYDTIRWFMIRPPEQTIPQRALEWARTHKFWIVYASVLLIGFILGRFGINAWPLYLGGSLVLSVYTLWWLSQRGKRKKEMTKEMTNE